MNVKTMAINLMELKLRIKTRLMPERSKAGRGAECEKWKGGPSPYALPSRCVHRTWYSFCISPRKFKHEQKYAHNSAGAGYARSTCICHLPVNRSRNYTG